MKLTNTSSHYGLVAIVIHWVVAVAVIGLFASGLYMVELSYADPWYTKLPHWHKSAGMLLLFLLFFRLAWSLFNVKPGGVAGVTSWEQRASHLAHIAMSGLLLVIVVMGYLIPTAEGSGIDVFGWFEVPALVHSIDRQQDLAGEIHYWCSIAVIALASIHAIAALRHHFFNRDDTLRRMLGR